LLRASVVAAARATGEWGIAPTLCVVYRRVETEHEREPNSQVQTRELSNERRGARAVVVVLGSCGPVEMKGE